MLRSAGRGAHAIVVAGSDLRASIGDQHSTPGIVEEVTPNTSVTFDGVFAATVSNTETIAGAFAGRIDHAFAGRVTAARVAGARAQAAIPSLIA